MERMFMYLKDVRIITGKSERWGREILKKIKSYFKKDEHHFVTIDEFCTYYGLDETKVRKLLKY